MNNTKSINISLQFEQSILVACRYVTLGDLAKIFCSDKELEKDLKALHILTLKKNEKKVVFSAIDIIQIIGREYQNATVDIFGEDFFLITLKDKSSENILWQYAKVFLVSTIMFFGAAFSIATFNNDVDVTTLFKQLLSSIGENESKITILQISYSIGIPIGMLVFYNHISKKSMYNDPTPLEVEMRLYEQESNMAAIQNESRKKEHQNE